MTELTKRIDRRMDALRKQIEEDRFKGRTYQDILHDASLTPPGAKPNKAPHGILKQTTGKAGPPIADE